MKLLITKTEQAFTNKGAEYLKITGVDENNRETTKSVFDNLKGKWSLLVEGNTVELKLKKVGQYWNIEDILPTEGETPTPKATVTHQEAQREPFRADPDKTASIEKQVAVKSVVELWIAEKLERDSILVEKTITVLDDWLRVELKPAVVQEAEAIAETKATELITKDQMSQLMSFKNKGLNVNQFIKDHGIKIKAINEMSREQAAMLIMVCEAEIKGE